MSNRNSKNKSADDDFEGYRQIAPEVFSDDKLRNLIKSKNNDRAAILSAIENIWHDTPDQQAVGSEWVTTSKTAKKDISKPLVSSTRRGESGGRGGGRGARQTAGGRGNGESRGEKVSSAPKVAAPAKAAPVVVAPVAVEEVAAVAPVTNSSEEATSVTKPAWVAGLSFADKLKKQEADKAKAIEKEAKQQSAALEVKSAVVVESAETTVAEKKTTTPRTRSRKRSGSKKSSSDETSATINADSVEALSSSLEDAQLENTTAPVEVVSEVVVAASAEVQSLDQNANGFLKLGKWDSPAGESTEMFQFGSFGNVNFASEGDLAKSAGASSSWGAAVEETVSGVVQDSTSGWASSTEPLIATGSASTIGSLLTSTQSKPLSSLETPVTAAATRPPPGLEQPNQSSAVGSKQSQQQNSNRSAPGAQIKYSKDANTQGQHQSQQSALYPPQGQQYSQQGQQQLPPGISPAANRNSTSAPSTGLPYAYSPSFELNQSQFLASTSSTPATSLAPGSAAPGNAAAPGNNNTLQQQQQYAPAAPFPFYGNPYYNQAFYYGQPQVPFNYNQGPGRGLYPPQQQRPYGNDPYAPSGSLYPTDLYQQGQPFPDSTSPYGAGAVGGNQTGSKAGKGGATANATANATLPQTDLYSPYINMNPYNRDAWQFQNQAAAAGWGGPMMSFPSPGPAGGAPGLGGNHFAQQQPQHLGAGQQQTQQQTTQSSRADGQRGPPAAYTAPSTYGARSNNTNGSVTGGAAGNVPQGW